MIWDKFLDSSTHSHTHTHTHTHTHSRTHTHTHIPVLLLLFLINKNTLTSCCLIKTGLTSTQKSVCMCVFSGSMHVSVCVCVRVCVCVCVHRSLTQQVGRATKAQQSGLNLSARTHNAPFLELMTRFLGFILKISWTNYASTSPTSTEPAASRKIRERETGWKTFDERILKP